MATSRTSSTYSLPGDCSCIQERLAQFDGVDRNELWFVVLWKPVNADPASANNRPILCKQRYLAERLDVDGRPIDIEFNEESKQYRMSMIVGPIQTESRASEIIAIELDDANAEDILRKLSVVERMLVWTK